MTKTELFEKIMEIKNAHKKNFRVLPIFVLGILLISICSIIAAEAGAGQPTLADPSTKPVEAGTGATASTGTTAPISVPETAKEPEKVGDKVIPGAKPEDATIKGGTLTPAKDGKGGDFVAGGTGTVGGNKDTDLGNNGDLQVNSGNKDTKLNNIAEGSKVSIDEKGNVKDLDAKGVKADKPEDATNIKISGKTTDTEVKLPEGAEMKKEAAQINTIPGKDGQKSDIYSTELGDGSKSKTGTILEKPTRTKKKEEDKEGNDPYYRFNGINIGLSDAMTEQLGLPKSSKFSGTLTMDPSGNWFSDKGVTFFDSKGNQILKDYGLGTKFGNVNDRTYYFSKSEFDGAQGKLFKDNGGGSYVVSDDSAKKIALGSTNDKYSTYIELGKQNPYSNYQAGMMTGGKSEVSVQASTGDKPPIVKMQGNEAMYYGGEGVGYAKIGDKIFVKEGAKLTDVIPNSAGIPSFERSSNYKADIYSLGEGGNVIANQKNNIHVLSGISSSGALTNEVLPLDKKGNPIIETETPRVQGNQPPQGKGASPSWLDRAKGLLGLGGGGTTNMPEAGKNLLNSIKPPSQQVEITLANGEKVPLFGTQGTRSANGGKGLIIIASQPGCPPCLELAKNLRGNIPEGVQVVTIDVTQNIDLAKRFGLPPTTPSAIPVNPYSGQSVGNAISGVNNILGFIQSLK